MQVVVNFTELIQAERKAMVAGIYWKALALTSQEQGCDHIEVYGIRYTICSPLQTTFKWCSMEGAESRLWRRANHLVYSKYRIPYTFMWSQPNDISKALLHKVISTCGNDITQTRYYANVCLSAFIKLLI